MTPDELDPRWPDAIRRHADTATPSPEAWAAITGRAADDDVADDVEVAAGRPERGRWLLAAAAVVVLLTVGAAVVATVGADDDGPVTAGPTTSRTTAPPSEPLVEGAGMVLDDGRRGPVLCVGGGDHDLVGRIEPEAPVCDGIPIDGWDWDDVEEERTVDGTTSGRFHLVGRFVADRFVLDEARDASAGGGPDPDDPLDDPGRFAPPCPAPFGWATRDPARIGEEQKVLLMLTAQAQPDFGAIWVDESIGVPGAFGVFTATFTGDLDRHRQELEAIWGGPLCVAEAPISAADLRAAEGRLAALRAPADGPIDVAGTTVHLGAVFTDGIGGQLVVEVVYAPPGAEESLSDLLGVPVVMPSAFRPLA